MTFQLKSLENHDDGSQLTRRTFCGRVVLTSTGLILAARTLKAAPATDPARQLIYPPMKIEGAEKVIPGSFMYFSYPRGNDAAVLVRSHDGEFVAYSRKCAHLGCSVDFDSALHCLRCPCHQGAYDSRTGSVIYGPPPRPLDQVILQVRAGGEVWAVGKAIGSSEQKA